MEEEETKAFNGEDESGAQQGGCWTPSSAV